jgi:hypothetical protein
MSIVESKPRTMTEQAVDALASFEPMIEMLIEYGNLTVAEDGIGKVEEAHKAVKRLRVDLDKKRKELNEGALHYQRTVNATAKTLTERISAVESRLEAQRENYEAEKMKEKQAKEAAKAAVLNERVSRLSSAGVAVTDLAALGAMANDEFEFYFAKESRVAAEAKEEADRLETLRQEEIRRQAYELRIRAEEIERQRLADEAILRAERESIEADRAEMRRQQEELQKHQAELRAKAEAEAAEKRRLEKEAEQARREAAAAPELEKLESVLRAMAVAAESTSAELGDAWWLPILSTEFLSFCEQMRKSLKDRS